MPEDLGLLCHYLATPVATTATAGAPAASGSSKDSDTAGIGMTTIVIIVCACAVVLALVVAAVYKAKQPAVADAPAGVTLSEVEPKADPRANLA